MQDVENAGFVLAAILGFALAALFETLRGAAKSKTKNKPAIAKFIFNNPRFKLYFWTIVAIVITFPAISFLIIISVYRDYPFAIVYDLVNNPTITIFSRFFIISFTGILTGTLIHPFWHIIQKGLSPGILEISARVVPIIFFVCIGVLKDEIAELGRYFESVKTPYFQIDFDRQQDKVNFNRLGFAEHDDLGEETDFQNGVYAYNLAVGGPVRRYLYVRDLCKEDLEACGIDNKNAELFKKYFTNAMAYSLNLTRFKECIEKFSNSFVNGVPIQDELSELSVDFTRSLILSSLLSSLPKASDSEQLKLLAELRESSRAFLEGDGPQHYKGLTDKILDVIALGAMIESIKPDVGSNDLLRCADTPPVDRLQTIRANYAALQRIEPDPFPYRAMIGTSILHMSGHPTEAAQHIDREVKRWLDYNNIDEKSLTFPLQKTDDNAGFGSMDLLSFMAGMDILFLRDFHFKYANMKQKLPGIRERVHAFVGLFLLHRTNLKLEIEKRGSAVRSALNACSMHASKGNGTTAIQFPKRERSKESETSIVELKGITLIEGDSTSLENRNLQASIKIRRDRDLQGNSTPNSLGILWEITDNPSPSAKSNDASELFLAPPELTEFIEFKSDYTETRQHAFALKLMHYYIYRFIQHYRSISNSGDIIEYGQTQEVETLYRIATQEPGLIKQCFGISEREISQDEIRLGTYDHRALRFLFAFTYGEMMASKAQEIQKTSRLFGSATAQNEAIKHTICEAEKVLKTALVYANDTDPNNTPGTVIPSNTPVDEEIQRALDILRTIPPDECEDYHGKRENSS